jgi:hypothetical protein
MDAKVKEAKAGASDEVEKMKAALRALPDPTRAEILEGALDDLTILPFFCPFFISNSTEQDVNAIMQRTQIFHTIRLGAGAGSVLNVGDDFEVDVTVRNCTSHYLRNPELVAGGTAYANVVGASVIALGDLNPGQSTTRTLQCRANAVTPTQSGPADPVINLSVRGALDFRVSKSEPVLSEVFPS